MTKCVYCNNTIPKERLEVNSQYCVNCVDNVISKPQAFMVYGHKTAPEIIVVDSRNGEAVRQATRANRRAR